MQNPAIQTGNEFPLNAENKPYIWREMLKNVHMLGFLRLSILITPCIYGIVLWVKKNTKNLLFALWGTIRASGARFYESRIETLKGPRKMATTVQSAHLKGFQHPSIKRERYIQ
jgi:hypothetical protein